MAGEPNEPTASVAAAGNKPKAKPKAKSGNHFGDAPISHGAIDPTPVGKRTFPALALFGRTGGVMLHPFGLALLSAAAVGGASPKATILAGAFGFALASALIAVLASATQRYGVSLGVLSRYVFGVRGARVHSVLRGVSSAGLFGYALVSAATSLYYGAVCAFPRPLIGLQKYAVMGLEPAVIVLAALLVWPVARAATTRTHWPLLASIVALGVFFVSADVASPLEWLRGSSEVSVPSLDATLLVFVGVSILLLLQFDAARQHDIAAAPVVAPFVWLAPWLVVAASFAAMGGSLVQSMVSDPVQALCSRLPTSTALLVGGLWAVAFVWPFARLANEGVVLAVEELSGALTRPQVKLLMRWALIATGVVLGLLARTSIGAFIFLSFAMVCVSCVAFAVFVAVDFMVVRRGRAVLDDLYTMNGPLYGVLGVLPAGVLAVVLGIATATLVRLQTGVGTTALLASLGAGSVVTVVVGWVSLVVQAKPRKPSK